MNKISATIITLNEAENLPRCLQSLQWADELIVVDSGSTDRTIEIAKAHGARVYQQAWLGYGQQKNFAASQASHEWILNIDADEVVSEPLKQEIENFLRSPELQQKYRGGQLPRKTWYLDRFIRFGGWYPNLTMRLGHRDHARWTEPAVHETLLVKGDTITFSGDLLHYTFRDIGDQVQTNIRYAREGALVACAKGSSPSLIRLLLKPWGKFFECYIWKRGFLDGLPGFIIAVNAAHSMFMKQGNMLYKKTLR